MTRLRILVIILFATAVVGLGYHWSPARQVELHQRNLQRAVEKRDWPRVGEFLAPDYKDRWGQNRALVLERLPQAFQDFLAIGIVAEDAAQRKAGDDRVWSARITIVGSGGPLSQYVMQQMETLEEPFSLTWQRRSWKPWDWQLIQIDQPEIDIPEFDFQ